MNANELRIGNWVFYLDSPNKVCAIESPKPNKSYLWDGKWIIEINPPDVFNVTIDQLNPIPLTEEWLTRFGFEESGWNYWESKGSYFELAKTKDGYINSINCHEYENGNAIQYVHQLQNLYFALTGQELKLNP